MNVRIIAGSKRDLKRMVAEGTVREDLYYRLNVLPITLRTGCVAASIMFRAGAQLPTSALDDALPRETAPVSLDARLGELEASLITWALKACDGKASRAAELLQIKRSTLQDRSSDISSIQTQRSGGCRLI